MNTLNYSTYTDTGGRLANEDSVRVKTLSDGSICLIAADGLGGHGGGDQASKAAADYLAQAWNGQTDPDEIRPMLLEANRRVLDLQTKLCEMKTTLVMLAVNKDKMLRAHVGDSRLYHFLNGKLIFQSLDHSVAQMSVMLGDIAPEEIRFNEDRSRVLRALGQGESLNAEIAAEELTSGQHDFLLCTDGFWEYVLEEEMEADLADAESPEDWIIRMRNRLDKRVKEMYGDKPENDNNTAAALRIIIQQG